jgi:hypothetical protein
MHDMKKIVQFLYLFIIAIGIIACTSDESDGNGGNGNSDLSYALTTGASANALLSDARFDEIIIEAVYAGGFKPEQSSLNNLVAFLNARLHKPNGISIIEREVPAQGLGTYSIEEVRDIEDNLRTQFSTDNTLAVFVFFAEESNESDTGSRVVLGTAYRNTSLVMFQKTIEEFSGGLNEPSRENVESTVYQHEFCHIMGLVNIGTALQSSHEDDANNGHCDVEGCLMSAQLEAFNPLDMLSVVGSSVAQLEAQCILDLQANGGK